MYFNISNIPSIVFILFYCTNKCFILKFCSKPFKEVRQLLLSHTIYKLGKLLKFVNTVAFLSPKCNSIVYFASLEFLIGMTSQGLAYISVFAGFSLVSKRSKV